MLFNITIKNLGKLSKAEIRLGKFTVFAGPNNTGKSYVSKALYSIFGGMNANHLAVVMGHDIRVLKSVLNRIERDSDLEVDSLAEMLSAVSESQKIINNISVEPEIDEFAAIEKALPNISESVKNIHKIALRLRKEVEEILDGPIPPEADPAEFGYWVDKDDLENMMKTIHHLQTNAENPPGDIIERGLKSEVRDNFLNNFQVSRLSDLYNGEDGMDFDISGIGTVTAHNSGSVKFDLRKAGLHRLQRYSRVLYLESPFHWKMKSPLDRVRKAPRFFFSGKEEYAGVPKYVYDMYDNFDSNHPEEMIFPGLFDRLTGKDVLGGKLIVSKTGELRFQEGERSFPLHLSATGVANLGMLALLMESNLLNENTFLFVDEPEANLHPAWQVEMVKALYELSKEGVNVVIATHSADIAKWLEVFAKKHKKEAEQNIELNHFHNGTVETNGGDILKRINAVQEDLANPYFKMFVSGL